MALMHQPSGHPVFLFIHCIKLSHIIIFRLYRRCDLMKYCCSASTYFLLLLGYANSFLNPIIYAQFNRDFRIPFIYILRCQCANINTRIRTEQFTHQFGLPKKPSIGRDNYASPKGRCRRPLTLRHSNNLLNAHSSTQITDPCLEMAGDFQPTLEHSNTNQRLSTEGNSDMPPLSPTLTPSATLNGLDSREANLDYANDNNELVFTQRLSDPAVKCSGAKSNFIIDLPIPNVEP